MLGIFIHSFIIRFPMCRSGALQQTFYGSPPTCPVLGFLPPCVRKHMLGICIGHKSFVESPHYLLLRRLTAGS